MTARNSTGFSLAPWMDHGKASSIWRCCARAKRGSRGGFRPSRREPPHPPVAAPAVFPARPGASRLTPRERRPPKLALRELTVVRLAMKPELVTGDGLLHG